ncbi:NAD(P)H dehydrogenase assembly family protein [Synechococcus sp. BA-124 BA4]|jgi:hypothetical protein|uniref:NAD(P)H dehydrogenase assembly family protein n=1 Tax=unclassified Synechococcus TaxID=2626047 RepID=UPI002AD36EB8|nr:MULTISPECIES: NAD(P)H dehydrogenase assembly family protein [unclassified Synechococcus]MEA5399915.1 NAD(P)H dehydrogenase assembly family protein [Synechococcus sp. BA-124 BA4]CAK6699265.1 hypothetical protein BBFGKLBO_02622 [Synechococcus sp. CBW1107]
MSSLDLPTDHCADPMAEPPEPQPTDPKSTPAGEPGRAPFSVGDWVRIKDRITYLKTADPMPMLRPPDLVDGDEAGQVMALRAINQLAVRFRRGTFLLGADQLSACTPEGRPRG